MKALIVLLMAALLTTASATIINIPSEYATIQAGIDASSDGDTVLVQPGTYVENINFNGHNIVLGSLFLTTGDTSYIEQTVIDGDSSGSVVTFESGEDSTAVITGFTIQNGLAHYGGGIFCSYTRPAITHNIITSNWAQAGWFDPSRGGGIYCVNSEPYIANNNICDNVIGDILSYYDGFGGGIACWDNSSPVIENNIITNNRILDFGNGAGIKCFNNSHPIIIGNFFSGNIGDNYGGTISCQLYSQALIYNNVLENNRGAGISCDSADAIVYGNVIKLCTNGSGIECRYSSPLIMNNLIIRNQGHWAGGIYLWDSSPRILNNTISRNSPNGIACKYHNTFPSVINTIIWGNYSGGQDIEVDDISYPQFSYCNILGGWSGEGNIDIDPLFRDPDNGDYHLMAIACGDPYDSPCIDGGDPSLIDSLLDCGWGLGTERSDMGAYGGGEGFVGIDEHAEILPSKISLSQNYPNPFNISTVIKYELPAQSRVMIDIYDILGRKVSTLEDALQPAGYHELIWNAEGLSSGVYFYKLQAGNFTETRKMMLIK